VLAVDHVIVCAGQESVSVLAGQLAALGVPASKVHIIGGALLAAELDAERAIREGVVLAARL
jgi:2,4-dienoyl-CoA reductase (NADPH2)